MARRLDLNKATAHSLLNTMAAVGLLDRHLDFTYTLGRELVAFGQAALARHRMISFARQEAATLAAETRMNCSVSIQSGEHVTVVGNFGVIRDLASQATPLVPPFGSVFLAWAGQKEIDDWILRAGNISRSTRTRLLEGLEGVRDLGFHITRPIDRLRLFREFARIDGYADNATLARSVRKVMGDLDTGAEYTMTRFSKDDLILPELIAMPAFGASEEVAIALTISGFTHPLNLHQIADYVRILRGSCDRITGVGGGRMPASFPRGTPLEPEADASN